MCDCVIHTKHLILVTDRKCDERAKQVRPSEAKQKEEEIAAQPHGASELESFHGSITNFISQEQAVKSELQLSVSVLRGRR